MTIAAWLLLGLLIGMVYCFLTEKVPMDLTAFVGLIGLVLLKLISPAEAFDGFSSAPIITIISIFFISAGLRETGIADSIARHLNRMAGSNEALNVAAVVGLASFFSAFMNNVAAVALLLPSVMAMAGRAKIPPSRLLIPLSFGTLLGGMTTLIGTPPNMLADEALRRSGYAGFYFLHYTPLGLVAVVIGILYFALWGRHLLPRNEDPRLASSAADLVRLYKLFERIFAVRIARGATLHGKTIADTHLGDALGAQVIAIVRDRKQHLGPGPRDVLREGDVLVLGGRVADFQAMRYFSRVSADNADGLVNAASPDIRGATFTVADKVARETTISTLEVHSKYGVVIVGISRGDKLLFRDIPRIHLLAGDVLHVLGTTEAIHAFMGCAEVQIGRGDMAAPEILARHLFIMRIPGDSVLGEISVRDSRLGELLGLTVVGIVRQNRTMLAVGADERIQPGDRLLVVGEPKQLERLNTLSEFEILSDTEQRELESSDVGLVEVILSPRSKLVGSSLRELHFREHYDFQVLGIWREGNPYRSHLGDFVLRLGDALLLQGPRSKMPLLLTNPDFVVLTGTQPRGRMPHKSWVVLLALAVLVFVPALDIYPAHLAAFMAATLVVAGGAIRMQDAYREVEWRVVFFIACLIPLGAAMEHSGVSALLAGWISHLGESLGPYAALLILSVAASFVSQVLDGTPAVVVLAPIAIHTAEVLHVDPQALVMGVALGASVAFLTPFSHKASLLVMGPGGYRASDFFTVGAVLSVLILLLMLVLLPVLFPF